MIGYLIANMPYSASIMGRPKRRAGVTCAGARLAALGRFRADSRNFMIRHDLLDDKEHTAHNTGSRNVANSIWATRLKPAWILVRIEF